MILRAVDQGRADRRATGFNGTKIISRIHLKRAGFKISYVDVLRPSVEQKLGKRCLLYEIRIIKRLRVLGFHSYISSDMVQEFGTISELFITTPSVNRRETVPNVYRRYRFRRLRHSW